jgi:hypothetical protein
MSGNQAKKASNGPSTTSGTRILIEKALFTAIQDVGRLRAHRTTPRDAHPLGWQSLLVAESVRVAAMEDDNTLMENNCEHDLVAGNMGMS